MRCAKYASRGVRTYTVRGLQPLQLAGQPPNLPGSPPTLNNMKKSKKSQVGKIKWYNFGLKINWGFENMYYNGGSKFNLSNDFRAI